MTKVRTVGLLQDALDREYAWRLRELNDLRMAIRTARADTAQTLIRAGVTMLYAHWEGFIKASTEVLLEYLAFQGLSYRQLRRCYIALGLKGQLAMLAQTTKPRPATAALDFILDNLDRPANLPFRDWIDTESNLSSRAFASIAGWVGIDVSRYETKFPLIDTSLVGRRNRIAHGEYLDLDAGSYIDLSDHVIELLRWYKTDIENIIALKAYLSPAA